MQEIGISSTVLEEILAGDKTIETRIAKERFLNFKIGEKISLREDVWKNGTITKSIPGRALIIVTNVQRFNSFRELLESVGFRNVRPSASTLEEALKAYEMYYTKEDEKQFGVVAISFDLVI